MFDAFQINETACFFKIVKLFDRQNAFTMIRRLDFLFERCRERWANSFSRTRQIERRRKDRQNERERSEEDETRRQHKRKKRVLNSIKKSASQRISIEFEISFNNAFDMIANFFNVVEDNDEENDWIANDDSTSESVKENDDEARSRKRSIKIALWFFFLSIEDSIIEKKKTTKIISRFFFFSKRTASDDDMMTMILVSISNRVDKNISFAILIQSSFVDVAFFRTSLSEFFNR